MTLILPALYGLIDKFTVILMYLLVDFEDIRRTIEVERGIFSGGEKSPRYHVYEHGTMLQTRASGLLAHVSIMIAATSFVISGYSPDDPGFKIMLVELSVYFYLAILCLRNMRSFGFWIYVGKNVPSDKKRQEDDYYNYVLDDIVFRYGIQQFTMFLAVITTVGFILTVWTYEPNFAVSQSNHQKAD